MKPDLVISVRRPPGSPHVYRLGDDEIRVGRSPACHVRLPDPRVSGLHLVFRRTKDSFEILDPGSKHGAYVGRIRLEPGTPKPVQNADLVTVGPFTLEVFLEAAAKTTTDAVETSRLAHALAMEAADRVRAPYLISVTAGAHMGEILAPTQDNPVHLNTRGDALSLREANDSVAATLSIGPGGRLWVEHLGGEDAQSAPLKAGDRLKVGQSTLEIRARNGHMGHATQPSWTPFEMAIVAGVALCLTATLAAAWWGA